MTQDTDQDSDLTTAQRGIEVETFLSSPIGTYLLERAVKEIDDTRLLLDVADPDKPSTIRALQGRIAVAQHVGTWLREVLEDGYAAEARIRGDDAESKPY